MNENTAGLSTKWLKRQIKEYGAALAEIVKSLATKQDKLATSEDLSLSEESVLSLTPSARLRPFVELCRVMGVPYNESTGFFELNGLKDITEAQMRAIYAAGVMTNDNRQLLYAQRNIRTHLPPRIAYSVTTGDRTFVGSKVEVVDAQLLVPGVDCFNDCQKLKSIRVYSPNVHNAYHANTYRWCHALEELRVTNVYARDIWLGHSPLLSVASFRSIIAATQAGMAAFVVTVHPDVYAKLTGDTTNEAAAALTEEELAKWAQLLSDAAEKEITFTIPS